MSFSSQNEALIGDIQHNTDNNIQNGTSSSSNIPKNPKSKKIRKPQTDEEYKIQRKQFYEAGPMLNTENWFLESDILALNVDKKSDRAIALHACEKAYFIKDYQKCLELIKNSEILFGLNLQDNDNERNNEPVGKKNKKMDKNISEILKIKERCLEKISNP